MGPAGKPETDPVRDVDAEPLPVVADELLPTVVAELVPVLLELPQAVATSATVTPTAARLDNRALVDTRRRPAARRLDTGARTAS